MAPERAPPAGGAQSRQSRAVQTTPYRESKDTPETAGQAVRSGSEKDPVSPGPESTSGTELSTGEEPADAGETVRESLQEEERKEQEAYDWEQALGPGYWDPNGGSPQWVPIGSLRSRRNLSCTSYWEYCNELGSADEEDCWRQAAAELAGSELAGGDGSTSTKK